MIATAVVPLALCLSERVLAATDLRAASSADEATSLLHTALAPSGNNAQRWKVQIAEPGHWLIGTEKSRWLPAVDPANRETTLSVGAFLENPIVAAERLGYAIDYQVIAKMTTEPRLIELRLRKGTIVEYPIARLEKRRTLRSGYNANLIKPEDIRAITDGSADFFYFARDTKPARYISESTIDANRKQTYRDPAPVSPRMPVAWFTQAA